MRKAVRLPSNWRRLVGTRLAEARRAADKSQRMLSMDTGLMHMTISKIERGINTPALATMILWCKACKIPAWVILEGIA